MKNSMLFILCIMCLIGCKSNSTSDNNQSYSGDNSNVSVDWDGRYLGVLPCADCNGIKTTIDLNKDKTFSMSTVYLGKSDQTYTHNGSFEWYDNGSKIKLKSEDMDGAFIVGENQLIHLDKEGNRIDGDMGDKYVLKKLDMSTMKELTDNKWKLTRLLGRDIEIEGDKDVFLEFDASESRVSGFAGCNNFFGTFIWEGDTRIRFSQIGSTQKMCIKNMEIESDLLKALQNTDSYTINNGVLSISKARRAPFAQFQKM
ncbi:copper resistance protein NlpE N-terminal domain-containing protein [Marinigracilibium pacificum]|uniref:META domain-containing protein n=1 Tax=Marinigracilibium pacificum TaxID=2729599 RepID=A0A848J006_9BACT|nr:copper resistance protein NlpE N-terminal domain-containing protein [Marinigracilibium pacificum]NMM50123.1 META domain-containing protein [Marinigracilibium pacificum]